MIALSAETAFEEYGMQYVLKDLLYLLKIRYIRMITQNKKWEK